jgi:hypothetical protein
MHNEENLTTVTARRRIKDYGYQKTHLRLPEGPPAAEFRGSATCPQERLMLCTEGQAEPASMSEAICPNSKKIVLRWQRLVILHQQKATEQSIRYQC